MKARLSMAFHRQDSRHHPPFHHHHCRCCQPHREWFLLLAPRVLGAVPRARACLYAAGARVPARFASAARPWLLAPTKQRGRGTGGRGFTLFSSCRSLPNDGRQGFAETCNACSSNTIRRGKKGSLKPAETRKTLLRCTHFSRKRTRLLFASYPTFPRTLSGSGGSIHNTNNPDPYRQSLSDRRPSTARTRLDATVNKSSCTRQRNSIYNAAQPPKTVSNCTFETAPCTCSARAGKQHRCTLCRAKTVCLTSRSASSVS